MAETAITLVGAHGGRHAHSFGSSRGKGREARSFRLGGSKCRGVEKREYAFDFRWEQMRAESVLGSRTLNAKKGGQDCRISELVGKKGTPETGGDFYCGGRGRKKGGAQALQTSLKDEPEGSCYEPSPEISAGRKSDGIIFSTSGKRKTTP